MQRYATTILDTAGNAVASATVTVNRAGTTTAATLYSDNVFTAQANPIIANADGSFEFYAAPGRYDLSISKTNFSFGTTVQNDILLSDDASFVTPATLTTAANDYNPTNGLNVRWWRIVATTTQSITGIVAGVTFQQVRIFNVGTSAVTIQHQNAGSTTANRILVAGGADTALVANAGIALVYDPTTARWRSF